MKEPDRVADYELLFEKLKDGIAELESDVTIQYRESINVSEEIEALRAITEQINAQSERFQLLTVG